MTIDDLSAIENRMVLEAEAKYGEFYAHAFNVSLFLSDFVLWPTHDAELFLRWLSQVKKHHTLALFSVARMHRIQANLCLRMALECTVHAAYSLAHPDINHYFDPDTRQVEKFDKANKASREWLEKEFPLHNREISNLKKAINESTAHANIINSAQNFNVVMEDERPTIWSSFFDFEDMDVKRAELWQVAQVGLIACDLIFAIQSKCGGFVPKGDCDTSMLELVAQNKRLLEIIRPVVEEKLGEKIEEVDPARGL